MFNKLKEKAMAICDELMSPTRGVERRIESTWAVEASVSLPDNYSTLKTPLVVYYVIIDKHQSEVSHDI